MSKNPSKSKRKLKKIQAEIKPKPNQIKPESRQNPSRSRNQAKIKPNPLRIMVSKPSENPNTNHGKNLERRKKHQEVQNS